MIADFEKALYIQPVKITDLVISSIPDTSGQSFITVHYNQFGHLDGNASDMAPFDIVFWVSLVTGTGRFGKKFFRGSLFKSDVVADGGLIKLADDATFVSRVAEAWTDLNNGLLTDGQSLLCGKNHDKLVVYAASQGATYNKPQHRWFNRT